VRETLNQFLRRGKRKDGDPRGKKGAVRVKIKNFAWTAGDPEEGTGKRAKKERKEVPLDAYIKGGPGERGEK